jgi:hypothetical protein
MALVSRSRDRGQLILVTGLTIAVILIMLVLLLNTVIYTENLATRGIDSGGGDAIEYRAIVVGSVGELIERENERYDGGHPPEQGVEAGIGEIDETLSERHLYRGTIAEVSSYEVEVDESSPRIWQHESTELTDSDGEADWTVMTSIDDIEHFILTIDSIDEWVNSENEGDNDRLHIIVDDGEWILEVRANEDSDFEVVVNGESETYDTDSLGIDLIEGEISYNNGETDDIDSIPLDRGPIEFENGDTTTGTFEIRADGDLNEGNLTAYDGGDEEDPYYTYPVESVDLTIHYETSELQFVTEETVTAVEEGEEGEES